MSERADLPPHVIHDLMLDSGAPEKIYAAYAEALQSTDYVYHASPQPEQVNVMGFRPLIFNRGGLETQAVLMGLPESADPSYFEQTLLSPKEKFVDSVSVQLLKAGLDFLEDGSPSAPSRIAARTESGLIGGIVIGRRSSGLLMASGFWHADFMSDLFETIDEAQDEFSDMLSEDDEFDMDSINLMNMVGTVRAQVNQMGREEFRARALTNCIIAAEELGPLVRVPAAGLNTMPPVG